MINTNNIKGYISLCDAIEMLANNNRTLEGTSLLLKGIIDSIEIMINNSYELSSHNKGVLVSALEVLKSDYLVWLMLVRVHTVMDSIEVLIIS